MKTSNDQDDGIRQEPVVHNDHNVYVLGAGFSVPAGAPTIATFMDRMRDTLDVMRDRQRIRERTAIERVLRFRHEASAVAYRVPMNVENIEELFSLATVAPERMEEDVALAISATIAFSLEAPPKSKENVYIHVPQGRRPQDPSPPSWYPKTWRTQPNAAATATRGNTKFTVFEAAMTEYEFYVAALLGFFSTGGDLLPRTTFLTFNYDTLLEETLHKLGVAFDLGPAISGGEQHSADCKVRVLKLHGSMSWSSGAKRKGGPIYRESYQAVLDADDTPLLVPPTWNKVFDSSALETLRAAVLAIRDATRIAIIGFSIPMTDIHFRYLVAAGLRDNISLRRLLYVDPNAAANRDRLFAVIRKELETQGVVVLRDQDLRRFLWDSDGAKELGRSLTSGEVWVKIGDAWFK